MAANTAIIVPAFLLVIILYLGFSNRTLKLELNDAVTVVEREQNSKLNSLKQCEGDLRTLTTDLKKLHTDYDACQVKKIAQSKDLSTLDETKKELEEKKGRLRQLEKAEKDLDKKNIELQEKEQEIEKINKDTAKAQTELSEAKSKSESLEMELKNLQNELSKLKNGSKGDEKAA